MVLDIQSKEVIDKISDELKVQPSIEIPRELAKLIQLVYNVNPMPSVQVERGAASDSTGTTIKTTDATKRTFLVGCNLSLNKDVLHPGTNSTISAVPLGKASITLNIIRYEPLTAGQFTNAIMFSQPIELDKNSNINLNNSSATASVDVEGLIYFYETDPQ